MCPETDGLGSVLLVGVIHEYPASVSRLARLLETFTRGYLALELPPLAVSLFRTYGISPPLSDPAMRRAWRDESPVRSEPSVSTLRTESVSDSSSNSIPLIGSVEILFFRRILV